MCVWGFHLSCQQWCSCRHWHLNFLLGSNSVTVQCPPCSWGSSSPTGSLGPGSSSWSPARWPAPSGPAVPAPPAPSLYTDSSTHDPPEPADPAGSWDQVLAAFASTLWNDVRALSGSSSAEWRWGAGTWTRTRTRTPGTCRRHAATPRRRCTSPEPPLWESGGWLHLWAGKKKKKMTVFELKEKQQVTQNFFGSIWWGLVSELKIKTQMKSFVVEDGRRFVWWSCGMSSLWSLRPCRRRGCPEAPRPAGCSDRVLSEHSPEAPAVHTCSHMTSFLGIFFKIFFFFGIFIFENWIAKKVSGLYLIVQPAGFKCPRSWESRFANGWSSSSVWGDTLVTAETSSDSVWHGNLEISSPMSQKSS